MITSIVTVLIPVEVVLTFSSVKNMITFHDPSRKKLGRKPL